MPVDSADPGLVPRVYWGHYWGQTGVKGPNLNSKCARDGGFEARLPLHYEPLKTVALQIAFKLV
jgi:hypothetical protein